MKKTFAIDGYTITAYWNFRTKMTNVTIVKDGKEIFNHDLNLAPFRIDYAGIIESLKLG